MANRPHRFPDFDYAGFNRYFLTICVNSRTPVFLNIDYGQHVAAHFLRTAALFEFEVLAQCVMPDHSHSLIAGQTDNAMLKPLMKRFKQETGYWWKHDQGRQRRLWQEGYFDRIMRDDDSNEGVIRYIIENPVRAGLVDDAREYPLISASRYDINDLLECAMLWTPPWKGGRRLRRT